MRFLALFSGGWTILTLLLSLLSSSVSDLALLLLSRSSSLQSCPIPLSPHLRLNLELHSVSVRSAFCFLFHQCPLSPGARPVGDVL